MLLRPFRPTNLWQIIVLVCFLLPVTGVQAQTQTPEPPIIIEPPILPPVWNMDGLRIDYQRVDVTIENQIATTRIDQLFVNENDWMLEGSYLFPLPAEATVTDLTMWIDGVPIESKILRKEEARAIYDEIVRQLRDPALLEYVGTQAIQASVFPIPPREERRIEIEYQQVLPADNGLLHYVYPQSTKLYTNLPLEEQSIRVDVRSQEAIRTVYSPSHRVAENRDGEFHVTVGYEAFDVTADTDFELYYSVTPEEIGVNLLSYKEAGQDGFFMLLAAPTVDVDPDEVVAKDVILVLDTSGSMEGEKMAQAKDAARFIVEQLNPQDRFNIVTFSTGVRPYAGELVPALEPGGYEQYINSLEAIGGTNISQALLSAIGQADAERPTTLIFLTDGLATEGIVDTPEIVSLMKEQAPRNVRLFAFGVGDDVDTLLLDSLTQNHRGTTSYVRPTERIDEEISGFYAKINTPVLANISIDYDGIVVEQLYPAEMPDLFAGAQLVIVGRYRDGGPARLTLQGDVNGEIQTFEYADNIFRDSGGDEFIPRLWATRAIGQLLTQIRIEGEKPELIESVVNLSIRYGIITPYTSYLIEEDDIFSQLGREEIVNESLDDAAADRDTATFGADAVEESEASAEMMEVEVAAAPPVVGTPLPAGTATADGGIAAVSGREIRYAGSKTFVLQDGVWYDTVYDVSMQIYEVGFASDTYFDLLSAAPELGSYFALGERVLVVYDGVVYEVVSGSGHADIPIPGGVVGVDSPTIIPATISPTPEVTGVLPQPTEPAVAGVEVTPETIAQSNTSVEDKTDGADGANAGQESAEPGAEPTARTSLPLIVAAVAVVGLIVGLVMRALRRS